MTTPDGYQIKTFTAEYTVTGALDGVTVGPPVKAPEKNDDPQQLYRSTVENLGLIDPDYVSGILGEASVQADQLGARGMRWIAVLWIEGPVAAGADAAVEVVDAVSGTVIVQEQVGTFVGQTQFFRNQGILVPQGSMLRLNGMSAAPGSSIKVRITIQSINSLEELTLVQKVLCECDDGAGCCPPAVLTPTGPLAADDPAAILTLPAGTCGLNEPLTGQVFNDPGFAPPATQPTINSITVNTGVAPTANTVEVSLDTTGVTGNFILVLTNDCGCCTAVRFTVIPS